MRKQILCSSCRSSQAGDAKIISSALICSLRLPTRRPQRGLNGYKFMLELVAGQMAEDHGYDSAIKRLQLVVEEIAKGKSKQ